MIIENDHPLLVSLNEKSCKKGIIYPASLMKNCMENYLEAFRSTGKNLWGEFGGQIAGALLMNGWLPHIIEFDDNDLKSLRKAKNNGKMTPQIMLRMRQSAKQADYYIVWAMTEAMDSCLSGGSMQPWHLAILLKMAIAIEGIPDSDKSVEEDIDSLDKERADDFMRKYSGVAHPLLCCFVLGEYNVLQAVFMSSISSIHETDLAHSSVGNPLFLASGKKMFENPFNEWKILRDDFVLRIQWLYNFAKKYFPADLDGTPEKIEMALENAKSMIELAKSDALARMPCNAAEKLARALAGIVPGLIARDNEIAAAEIESIKKGEAKISDTIFGGLILPAINGERKISLDDIPEDCQYSASLFTKIAKGIYSVSDNMPISGEKSGDDPDIFVFSEENMKDNKSQEESVACSVAEFSKAFESDKNLEKDSGNNCGNNDKRKKALSECVENDDAGISEADIRQSGIAGEYMGPFLDNAVAEIANKSEIFPKECDDDIEDIFADQKGSINISASEEDRGDSESLDKKNIEDSQDKNEPFDRNGIKRQMARDFKMSANIYGWDRKLKDEDIALLGNIGGLSKVLTHQRETRVKNSGRDDFASDDKEAHFPEQWKNDIINHFVREENFSGLGWFLDKFSDQGMPLAKVMHYGLYNPGSKNISACLKNIGQIEDDGIRAGVFGSMILPCLVFPKKEYVDAVWLLSGHLRDPDYAGLATIMAKTSQMEEPLERENSGREELARKTRAFLKHASTLNVSYLPVEKVLKKLLGKNGIVSAFLEKALEGDLSGIDEALEKYGDRSMFNGLIQRTLSGIRMLNPRDVSGGMTQKMLNELEEGISLLEEWRDIENRGETLRKLLEIHASLEKKLKSANRTSDCFANLVVKRLASFINNDMSGEKKDFDAFWGMRVACLSHEETRRQILDRECEIPAKAAAAACFNAMTGFSREALAFLDKNSDLAKIYPDNKRILKNLPVEFQKGETIRVVKEADSRWRDLIAKTGSLICEKLAAAWLASPDSHILPVLANYPKPETYPEQIHALSKLDNIINLIEKEEISVDPAIISEMEKLLEFSRCATNNECKGLFDCKIFSKNICADISAGIFEIFGLSVSGEKILWRDGAPFHWIAREMIVEKSRCDMMGFLEGEKITVISGTDPSKQKSALARNSFSHLGGIPGNKMTILVFPGDLSEIDMDIFAKHNFVAIIDSRKIGMMDGNVDPLPFFLRGSGFSPLSAITGGDKGKGIISRWPEYMIRSGYDIDKEALPLFCAAAVNAEKTGDFKILAEIEKNALRKKLETDDISGVVIRAMSENARIGKLFLAIMSFYDGDGIDAKTLAGETGGLVDEIFAEKILNEFSEAGIAVKNNGLWHLLEDPEWLISSPLAVLEAERGAK